MSDHPATVSPTTHGMHSATCPCGWMGADWADEAEAEKDAQLHREGKHRPWCHAPGDSQGWDYRRSRFR